MASKYTLFGSNGVDTAIDTVVTGLTAKMQAYNESGTSQIVIDLAVDGYNIQTKGDGQLPLGTGATDRMTGSAENDLVIWDSALVSGVSFDVPNGDRHRLNVGNATVAYEQFDLGLGNDALNLTYSAANTGIASPGAYGFDVIAWGNGGTDLILSGAGNDRLYGDGASSGGAPTTARDTLFGGAGNDTIFGDNGSTNADEAVGSIDTLFDGAGNDTLYGEGGSDTLLGSTGLDVFYGGGGNDTIDSGADQDDLSYGGAGDDRLIAADTGYGGDGNDTVDGGLAAVGNGDDLLYGDAGNDTVIGQNGDDTLYGGGNTDTLFGGDGADTLYGELGDDSIAGGNDPDDIYYTTDTIAAADTTITAWDGEFGSAPIEIVIPAGSNLNLDHIDGGTDSGDPDNQPDGLGTDAILMDMDPDAPRNVLTWTAPGTSQVVLSGVEVIVATLGADLINLTYNIGGSAQAYSGALLINANYGDDMVFSGSGSDTIVGDNFFPVGLRAAGNDLLYGGLGQDTIYGDYASDFLPGTDQGGDDTLYGGFADDTVYGGAGNDTIFDNDGVDAYGGLGTDVIDVHLAQFSFLSDHQLDGGLEDGQDGNDVVHVEGIYERVHSNLGAGDDVFIGNIIDESSEGGSGARADEVFGGTGNDAVATYFGDDTLFGGSGDDVLWGGETDNVGNTLYGGADSDYLYGGEGGNNLMYGGEGSDYYYWGFWQAGQNDQIYDLHRSGETPDGAANYLVVFGAFDTEELPSADEPVPDFLANGFGMFQASHDLTSPGTIDVPPTPENPEGSTYSDYLLLTDNGDGTWTLGGVPDSGFSQSITFDPDDIATIVLWNNDAVNPNDPNAPFDGPSPPVLTYYNWNGSTYVYSSSPL